LEEVASLKKWEVRGHFRHLKTYSSIDTQIRYQYTNSVIKAPIAWSKHKLLGQNIGAENDRSVQTTNILPQSTPSQG